MFLLHPSQTIKETSNIHGRREMTHTSESRNYINFISQSKTVKIEN